MSVSTPTSDILWFQIKQIIENIALFSAQNAAFFKYQLTLQSQMANLLILQKSR